MNRINFYLTLCVLFLMAFGCGKQSTDRPNPLDNEDSQYFYHNAAGKRIGMKQIEEKMFLQFALNADMEQLLTIISKETDLQPTAETGLKEGYWGFYIAVLEAKNGNTIPTETFEYFKTQDNVVAVSHLYSQSDILQETYKGITNRFDLRLNDVSSFAELQQMAEQHHCIIEEENMYDKNQFTLTVAKDYGLNALEMSNLFLETNLFDWVEPYFYTLNPPYYSCDDDEKKTVKVLKDEPVYVRKKCLTHVGGIDAFYFEFANTRSEFFSEGGIFPISEIPEKYRKEGQPVKISGNVINCTVTGGCGGANIRLGYMHLFELNSIK